jgi:hypothetical protein
MTGGSGRSGHFRSAFRGRDDNIRIAASDRRIGGD